MARLEGPLFSLKAHNTLGGLLEFSFRKGKNFLRLHQQPSGPASTDQITERGYYLEACEYWQTLTDEQKQAWVDFNDS